MIVARQRTTIIILHRLCSCMIRGHIVAQIKVTTEFFDTIVGIHCCSRGVVLLPNSSFQR
jgi:hypothetical protein